MDMPATSRKHPASSPLNVKAFQPTCSVRSIFLPRARRCLTLGPHPPPTMRSCFIGTGRGGSVIVREIVASRVQAPPPPPPPLHFVVRLRLQKGGGGIFAGHYGTYTYHYIIIVCVSYLEDGIFVHVCFLCGGVVYVCMCPTCAPR